MTTRALQATTRPPTTTTTIATTTTTTPLDQFVGRFVQIFNGASGAELALAPLADGGVALAAADDDETQRWILEPAEQGYFRIINWSTGQALDTYSDTFELFLTEPGNYSGQFWRFVPSAGGLFHLTNMFLEAERWLDVREGTIAMQPMDDDVSLRWALGTVFDETLSASDVVLHGDGIGVAYFGEPSATVSERLTSILGPPTLDEEWTEVDYGFGPYCLHRVITFPGDLNLEFAVSMAGADVPEDLRPFAAYWLVDQSPHQTHLGVGVGSRWSEFPVGTIESRSPLLGTYVFLDGIEYWLSSDEEAALTPDTEVMGIMAGFGPCTFE